MNSPLYETMRENGFPEKFINKYMEERPPKSDVLMAEVLFLTLTFGGDPASERLYRQLNAAIARTYPAAKIRLVFSSTLLLHLEGKDRLPFQTSSMYIYAFNCSCGAGYIARTARRLSKRMREHHPAWLNQGMVKFISSAIVAHLVDISHRVDVNQSFRVIYKVPTKHSKFLRQWILAKTEAVAIRLTNPTLYSQKRVCSSPKARRRPRHACSHLKQQRSRDLANCRTPHTPLLRDRT
ncbi:unnamed protein product [Schistocephalus solidus]|uniref:GIY-YIG domain-containing protein n=1 Tax=Schistocephalus solidus TaxID=70667 RepID=A0A183TMG4_SCHSO|nr:unnamed protein product [Schistocephalus solidus]